MFMALIFWDSQGIIRVDYLAKGCTIKGVYYADELRLLCQEIVGNEKEQRVERWQHSLPEGVIHYENNLNPCPAE